MDLLNNAAKYTDPQGRIWLTAARHGQESDATVRDTGVGIPTEILPTIFEMLRPRGPFVGKIAGRARIRPYVGKAASGNARGYLVHVYNSGEGAG